eukprot:TRINITY_DN3225_c0_g1_i2.p1 TRINITY_DN3225_c0_g1~~TRINITY_DN3225_c0_g1_i2.p1  ORF type:complete len:486 (+),score=78.56 TRINITY_DN3225_c0_g1_i2:885-2342(+)
MAELRYQLMEMLDHERELRARTEQASVHRVEELEAQLKRSRQETVAALARRRESEVRLEETLAEIASLQLQLKIEASSVNQLRLEIEDLKHLCETKEVELAWLMAQQRADMHAPLRANEVENVKGKSDRAYTVLTRVGHLSLSEDLGAESEANDSTKVTPKSEFVDTGLRLFKEWVKSGCLANEAVVQFAMAQHRGKELALELSSSNQFHGGCLKELVIKEELSVQSQTGDLPFPEALADCDKWEQDSALIRYVLQEDVHFEGDQLQAPNALHENLVALTLSQSATDEYEVEPEAGGHTNVLSCEVKTAISNSLQESFMAAGENVMIVFHVGEARDQDLREHMYSGDKQDDVHQLSEVVNEEDAATFENEREARRIERSPGHSEADKFVHIEGEQLQATNALQDCKTLAQGVSLVYAKQCDFEDNFDINPVSGDAVEDVYRLFEAPRTIDNMLLLTEVRAPEGKVECALQMLAPSLQTDDAGNLY